MGVIAQDLPTAGRIFREKIKDVYERLPDSIRALRAATQNSERAMEFSNKSRIWVDTSMRSGTLQFLHVSELGKIAAKYPGKAREIKTGAFPTVHSGQHIFVESTAEGQGGLFHEMVMTAREREDQGLELTPLEFKLHFVPWWNDNRYRIKTDRTIPAKHQAYFAELKRQHGIELDIEQQRWYSQQALQQGEDTKPRLYCISK